MTANLPAPTAENINEAHSIAKRMAKDAISHARRCGDLLAAMKASLPRGQFDAWVEAKCDFGRAMAYNYMKVAKSSDLLDGFTSIRAALGYESMKPADKSPKDSPKGAVSVVKPTADGPRGTEETGADRPAAPVYREPPPAELDPELAEQEAELELAEREYQDRITKVIESDDRLATAEAEIRRLCGLYAAVARERDRAQNEQGRLTRLLKASERKVERLERELQQLRERSAA
jgi:hypothetical protein